MGKTIRVFISSTWKDLQPERKSIEAVLGRMQDTTFAGMEYFGSQPGTPIEVSLSEIDRSDIYIGIFGHRYGSGITEAEYRRAEESELPCLIYLKDENVPVLPTHLERDPDLAAKLESLKQDLKAQHTISFFKNPDQLATQVVADLHNHFGSAPSVREDEPIIPIPKYQINITEGKGIVIGDHQQVTQIFGSSESPPSDKKQSINWVVKVKGEAPNYLIDENRFRHRIWDGPTLESLTSWEEVEELLSWDELRNFPPAIPHHSIVDGVKPWLVKVRGEKDNYLIDENGVRHRIDDKVFVESLNQRTNVDVFVNQDELELFQPGVPISNIGTISLNQTPESAGKDVTDLMNTRLHHLADNINKDLALLKEYEDALRYEDDPRRKARYRQEIEQLRESASRYQLEYDELRRRIPGTPSTTMTSVAEQLHLMDTKLDNLLEGQSYIRSDINVLQKEVLAQYEAGLQNIINTFIERLNQQQLIIVQSILEAIEADRVSESEMQEALTIMQQTLAELVQLPEKTLDPGFAQANIEQLSEAVSEPRMDVRHRLKITVPIIPLLLAYEGELELSSGMNLKAIWDRLAGK